MCFEYKFTFQFDLSQLICSYVMWPIAFVIGVDADECREAAKLIGGLVVNGVLGEYVAVACSVLG